MNNSSARSCPARLAWHTSRGPAHGRNRLACAFGAVATLGLLACGDKNKGAEEPVQDMGSDQAFRVDPTLCEVEGKRAAAFDLNRDSRPDLWKIYQNIQEGETQLEVLTCKQVDFDHDGRKDYVVAYNRKGGTTFEKLDFDFDGRFDAFRIFDENSGRLVEVQRDSDFDGRYDLLEVYDDDEVLTTIKQDRNADGAPDVWEQYVEGTLVAILYDDDYDNKVDRREEADVDEGPRVGKTEESAGAEQAAGTDDGDDDEIPEEDPEEAPEP